MCDRIWFMSFDTSRSPVMGGGASRDTGAHRPRIAGSSSSRSRTIWQFNMSVWLMNSSVTVEPQCQSQLFACSKENCFHSAFRSLNDRRNVSNRHSLHMMKEEHGSSPLFHGFQGTFQPVKGIAILGRSFRVVRPL